MAKRWSHTEAFASFGAECANQRWSWSARSPDGKVVVLTLWQDRLNPSNGGLVYHEQIRETSTGEWVKRPGNRERLDNLKWARDNCEGLFRVVIAIAEDVEVSPRAIKECFPKENLVMKLTELNETTGEFHAVSLPLSK